MIPFDVSELTTVLSGLPIEFARPWALLLILPSLVLLVLGWPRLRRFSRLRRRWSLGIRALILAAIVLALAEPFLVDRQRTSSLVVLIDESASIDAIRKAASSVWLERLLAERRPGDDINVIRFGKQPVLGLGRGTIDPSATDLAAALRLAQSTRPPGVPTNVVLISDGWETTGDAVAAARGLAPRGFRLSYVDTQSSLGGPEVAVQDLAVPTFARRGSTFEVTLTVDSTVATTATVRLFANGQKTLDQPVSLTMGRQRLQFTQRGRQLGLLSLRAEIEAASDTRKTNNLAEAATSIREPGRVLIVEGREGAAAGLTSLLRDDGVEARVAAPVVIPTRAAALREFDAIVLANVAATQFTLDQQQTLVDAVRLEGKGLFVTGGNLSFSLGGYAATPLNDLLPVSPEPPVRRETGTLALFLVIDKSASMDIARRGVSKMDMAREAAALAVEALRSGDTLGVLGFDSRFAWVVPATRIGGPADVKAAQTRIQGLKADGGTTIFPALEEAYKSAAKSDASLKHVILLTDGQSVDADYAGMIQRMKPSQITLSTIAVGSDSDTKLLTRLAELGEGRYYFTERPEDVPKITARETNIVTRNALIEGRVAPRQTEPSPVMIGLTGLDLPSLGGYIATEVRPKASTVLVTDRGDPILAHWQFGLGRVAAWTSDVSGTWSGEWFGSDAGARVIRQATSWVMPAPATASLRATADVEGQTVTLRASSDQFGRVSGGAADARVVVIPPNGSARELRLTRGEIGDFRVSTTLESPGVYEAQFSIRSSDGSQESESIGFAIGGGLEDRGIGVNRALLERLATITGGSSIVEPIDALNVPSAEAEPTRRPIWLWLVLFAALLLPVDVATRRLSL